MKSMELSEEKKYLKDKNNEHETNITTV